MRREGFTLIEMMVVMAIIALMAVVALPSVSSYFNVSLSQTGREMANTVKEAYNATVVTGQVHRIAYDLKNNTYWVETGPANVLLDTKESLEREHKMKRFALDDKEKEKEKEKESPFSLDKSITRKKVSLPLGVSFEDVQNQQSEDPLTEGVAYTHFFPQGMIEQTVIHVKDNSNHHVSLVLQPIVGKTDMYDRYVPAKEAFGGGK